MVSAGGRRRCLLKGETEEPCSPGECRRCGWNEPERRRRCWKLRNDGLFLRRDGLYTLTIPRKPELKYP